LPDAPAPLIYALEQDRLNLLQQSVQALRQSLQAGLALQTRLRPLLDTLALQIDAQGARLDFSALDAEIDRRLAADAQEGFGDLVDFNRATRTLLTDSGWTGWEKVADLLANDPRQDSFRSVLAEEGALVKGMAGFSSAGGNGDDWLVGDGGADLLQGNDGDDVLLGLGGNDTLSSGSGDDQLDGGAEADTLYAGLGNDLLLGGTGNDSLFANEGDDSLDGGAGNDSLTAGIGNDTVRGGTGSDRLIGDSGDDCYVFKRGDGVDTLVDGGPQCNDEKWRIAA
jgi:Ca2+-binding RTX toxin-like protein